MVDLYRGKRKDNGEWVYGRLLADDVIVPKGQPFEVKDCYIMADNLVGYEVIPESVGRYIELNDKNGKMIFEKDIVRSIYRSGYTGVPNTDFGYGIIEYCNTYFSGASYQIKLVSDPGYRVFSASLQVEVIGNIDDNPELLKIGASDA